MRTAIYIRVSTKKQVDEGYSLEAQEDKLIKLVELNNDTLFKIYKDEGKSGKNTLRPAFQEMMNDIKNGYIEKVLVAKLDRISRSVGDLENIINEFRKYNVHFVSASEQIDTSNSIGMMFIRLLGVFAQFERERITERINDTFSTMVDNGNALSGTQPYGYIVQNGKVIKDTSKAEIVDYFINTYLETNSLYMATKNTNLRYSIHREERQWKKTLTDSRYYGTYKTNQNYCESYITKETYDRIQIIRKKNIKVYSTSNRVYLFSGMLICKKCNHKIKGIFNNKIIYYQCKHCKGRTIPENKFELALLEQIKLKTKEFLDDYKISQSKLITQDNTKKINDIDNEITRLNNIYKKGRISEEEYDLEYSKLEKKKIKLLKITKKINVEPLEKIVSTNWDEIYLSLSKEDKQAVWRSFVERIEVNRDDYSNDFNIIFIN